MISSRNRSAAHWVSILPESLPARGPLLAGAVRSGSEQTAPGRGSRPSPFRRPRAWRYRSPGDRHSEKPKGTIEGGHSLASPSFPAPTAVGVMPKLPMKQADPLYKAAVKKAIEQAKEPAPAGGHGALLKELWNAAVALRGSTMASSLRKSAHREAGAAL